MEVPRLGVDSELQPPVYTIPIAMWNLSCVCNLHHSSRQHQILNPLSEARDGTLILMETSWIRFLCATKGTPTHALELNTRLNSPYFLLPSGLFHALMSPDRAPHSWQKRIWTLFCGLEKVPPPLWASVSSLTEKALNFMVSWVPSSQDFPPPGSVFSQCGINVHVDKLISPSLACGCHSPRN